jgi:hypothetical protein
MCLPLLRSLFAHKILIYCLMSFPFTLQDSYISFFFFFLVVLDLNSGSTLNLIKDPLCVTNHIHLSPFKIPSLSLKSWILMGLSRVWVSLEFIDLLGYLYSCLLSNLGSFQALFYQVLSCIFCLMFHKFPMLSMVFFKFFSFHQN